MKYLVLLTALFIFAGCSTRQSTDLPATKIPKSIVIPRTPSEIDAARNAYNSAPLLIERTEAVYPRSKIQSRASGNAVIEFFVERDGTVGETRVVSATDPAFGKAAIDCIKLWRFIAGNYHGLPARTRMQQVIDFNL